MMGLLDYKMTKVLMFGMTGFIPLFALIGFMFIGFDLLIGVIITFMLTMFLVFVGHVATSQNPFIKAIQSKTVLIFDVNSTGICRIYNAMVKESPNNTGIDIVNMSTGEVRAYDRGITHLLQAPQRAIMKFMYHKEEPKESMVHIELSNEEFKKAAWYSDYLTILFYNSQLGTFVTKPLVSEQEKTMLVEYLTLNEARELRQLNTIFLSLMRHTFDLIAQRFSGILGNPMVQIIIVGIVLAIGAYCAWQFLPGLIGGASGTVQGATGQVVEPLTKGVPVALMRLM